MELLSSLMQQKHFETYHEKIIKALQYGEYKVQKRMESAKLYLYFYEIS